MSEAELWEMFFMYQIRRNPNLGAGSS